MKQKDLKIDFRYLTGNIACLSVDSIDGESVHNDINNEEAIIIFNSLVGEKADCQTVKSLLKENQELKEKYVNAVSDYETTMFEKEQLKKQLEDKILLEMKLENELFNKRKEYQETYKDVRIEIKEYKTQQKEFIKWLENGIEKVRNTEFLDERIQRAGLIAYNRCLQKYKSIIGDDK